MHMDPADYANGSESLPPLKPEETRKPNQIRSSEEAVASERRAKIPPTTFGADAGLGEDPPPYNPSRNRGGW